MTPVVSSVKRFSRFLGSIGIKSAKRANSAANHGGGNKVIVFGRRRPQCLIPAQYQVAGGAVKTVYRNPVSCARYRGEAQSTLRGALSRVVVAGHQIERTDAVAHIDRQQRVEVTQ